MVGCRCSYKNCANTTKSFENIHFFHFPVKHRKRCIEWIENSGNPNFYELEEDQLKNKIICEVHFEKKWFLNNQRKRLMIGAVPTLDAGSSQSSAPILKTEPDGKVYMPSNQYSDVKVVPANDDGTVFVLDTENMFTISPKIESYIIKNGTLVPTNPTSTIKNTGGRFIKQSTSNRFTKPSTSTSGYVMGAESEIANINAPPGPGPSKILKESITSQGYVKKELSENNESNLRKRKSTGNGEITYVDTPKPMAKPEDIKSNPAAMARQTKQTQQKSVSKSYLRQITAQHSRDIASIKRMLKKQKIAVESPAKPDLKTILNELERQIPASLFTIISLLLGEKNELNDEDIEFFTTLHKGSPDIYQMLSDKYKWNLPSVDVVETPNE